MAAEKKGKTQPATKTPAAPPHTPEETARIAIRPSVNASAVVQSFGKTLWGDLDINELISQLVDGQKSIKRGDMSSCEAMLFSQATALQTIFASVARRANGQEYLKNYQAFMAIALKAQNQCRMTLETLSLLKNPPVFAKQANIAHGPQQVNNGTDPPAKPHARAENSQSAQNELLEARHGERLDTRTAGAAGGTDSAMETVDARDRPANG